ncbi:uncharacterized protein K02A2.6-like [Macrosteles quadrilineatus]|uniref:uncharacterized protein K02A2.6-like n=1 Tax=Macrosteles quadrilineatus TaxID=74068 RepID=UPI0023E254C5|nr:uncharacterized protein K02A2.6-like [Macrosteles quadrilineatus]
MKIEGKTVPMELDTGAALSTMSYKDFKKLSIPQKVFSTNVELRTYTGKTIKPRGVTFVNCMYKTQRFVGKLFLIEQNVDAIFGRDWLREVKLDWGEIKSLEMNQTSSLGNMLSDFSDVFDGKIGVIPDHLGQLRVMDDAKPIFVKPRQVPYSLRSEIEKELKRLEECGIITKVDHSDWYPHRACCQAKWSNLPLVLATNASPVGLGAILSHRYSDGTERPISFASRTLTKWEQKYSQIDKEATGIYWGLKKFFPYCYGRKFILVTDHKPLVSIFHPNKTLPSISATRLFNYAHFLSGFNYQIEYRKTTDHANADFLSRFPTEHTSINHVDDRSLFQISQLDSFLVDSQIISRKTAEDKFLQSVLRALQTGESVEHLGFHDNELTLQDGCIFKGNRVIIPEVLHHAVLQELHVGHLGMDKMKALARSYCTWRNIDKDIEQLVRTCKQCRLKQNQPAKETNHPWLTPQGPWERVHIDFAVPMQGQWYFIIVDAFTKWIEVIPTKNTSTEWCIRELRKTFATFGLPLVLVSDNGSQFTSSTFRQFLSANGVVHKTTAPYHPSSNGQAERYVQTIKKSLKAMEEEGGKLDLKLYRLLMQLRQSPNSTGSNAYSLIYGREIRTHLGLLLPQCNKSARSAMAVRKKFQVGDSVQARDYSSSKRKWCFGTVIGREGTLLYQVKMEDGTVWRRHIDQLLKCEI